MNETKKWRTRVANKAGRAWAGKDSLARARVRFTRFSSIRPDFDNLAASFKAVQDGLIDAGVISSDTFDIIGTPEYTWEKVSPKDGKIRVEVYLPSQL